MSSPRLILGDHPLPNETNSILILAGFVHAPHFANQKGLPPKFTYFHPSKQVYLSYANDQTTRCWTVQIFDASGNSGKSFKYQDLYDAINEAVAFIDSPTTSSGDSATEIFDSPQIRSFQRRLSAWLQDLLNHLTGHDRD